MLSIPRRLLHRCGLDLRRSKIRDRDDYVAQFGVESVRARRFYCLAAGGHFGFGGGFAHECWTNVDVVVPGSQGRRYDPRRDLACDLLALQRLPLASESAELVFSQFSIEHLTDPSAEHMLAEARRVLKPGGVLRVTCPNIDLDCLAYERADRTYFAWERDAEVSLETIMLFHFAAHACVGFEEGNQPRIDDHEFRRLYRSMPRHEFLDHCTSRCDAEIQKRRRRCHVSWWNPSKLSTAMQRAGFARTHVVGPAQSATTVFRNAFHFNRLFPEVAFTVEAVK